MCSCEFNFTCARHREPNPDLPDGDDPYNDQGATAMSRQLRITVTTSQSYIFDPDQVGYLHSELKPDPGLYSDDPFVSTFAFLDSSMFGADVFESADDFDQGYEISDYDPDD